MRHYLTNHNRSQLEYSSNRNINDIWNDYNNWIIFYILFPPPPPPHPGRMDGHYK